MTKTKKKILIGFLVVLALSLAASITTFAETSTSAYLSSDTAVSREGEITFTVEISHGTGVRSILIIPTYDSASFELVDGGWTITGGLMSDFSVDTNDGVIAFDPGISINGPVLNFTLRAKTDASFGTYTVSAEVVITDGTGTSTLSTSGTSVQIKCNHNFTKKDTTYLKSGATCTSPAIYYKSCEICGARGTETFEYGTTKEHVYTRKVIDDIYKVSDATCAEQAVYRYCCETCNAVGTATYKYGSTPDHSYTRRVIEDTYKVSDASCDQKAVYYYGCATCDAVGTETFEYGSALGHTGGTATCTSQAICARCHQPYGDTLDHTYDREVVEETYLASAASCTAKAKYYKSCTCGARGTETFEYGTTKEHVYTRKVIDDTYKVSDATCAEQAVYRYCCETCNAVGTATYKHGSTPDHSYTRRVIEDTYKVSDASCDQKAVYYYGCATCDAVGTETFEYGSALGHTGGTATCTSQAICTRCHQPYGDTLDHTYDREVVEETYLASAASCTAKAKYYKSCTCGARGKEIFEFGDKNDHTYTQKVEDRYLKSKATCTQKAVYYESCSVCKAKGTATFETGKALGHDYETTWSSDASAHWHECTVCGDKKDLASHTAGAAATANTAQTCTVCGYVIAPALGHTHNYNTMKNDETNHWNECACGDKTDVARHTWDDGMITKEATTDEEGVKTYTCTVCGYTKDESIAKLPPQTDVPPIIEVPTDKNTGVDDDKESDSMDDDKGSDSIDDDKGSDSIDDDKDPDSKNNVTVIMIVSVAVIAVIAFVAGVGVAVFIKKKKE